MLGFFTLIFNLIFGITNLMLCSLLICVIALFKFLAPSQKAKHFCSEMANSIMWLWTTINHKILMLFNRVEWDIKGGENLSTSGWYLVISNHLSWTDIVILCSVLKGRVPMPKFFLKQQLLYIPFLGMACWALDMPFMRRYSREFLIRNPHLKGKDLETTRRSCARFKNTPTTVVNYVEGTRYTPEKQGRTRGDFKHLLPPKSGGIAYTLAAMGEQFEGIVNITLAYPKNRTHPFKSVLFGQMKKVVVRIEVLPVDSSVSGDYFNDKPYKREFQLWLTELWKKKDKTLDEIYRENGA